MIIDVHQHLNFWGRSHKDFINHQLKMGVQSTILLPSDGTPKWYNLNGCDSTISSSQQCYEFTSHHPTFYFGANGHHRDPNIEKVLSNYVEEGAVVIGELKFCEKEQNKFLQPYIKIAAKYDIPILLHFQDAYRIKGKWRCPGLDINIFEQTLKENPHINFIGHAVDFWGKIHKISGKLMKKYKNLYADLSAGSCLSVLKQKGGIKILEDFQDKLMFGSDCADPAHRIKSKEPYKICSGEDTINFIKFFLGKEVQEKIFCENATKLLKLNKK